MHNLFTFGRDYAAALANMVEIDRPSRLYFLLELIFIFIKAGVGRLFYKYLLYADVQ